MDNFFNKSFIKLFVLIKLVFDFLIHTPLSYTLLLFISQLYCLVLVLVVNTRTNDRLDTTCFYRFVTGDAIIVYTQVLYVCTLNFV